MKPSTSAEVQPLLAGLLAGTLLLQALLPGMGRDAAANYPEVADLRTPITVLMLLAVTGGQVALLCLWRLVRLAARDGLRSRRARAWADALAAALLAAALLLGAVAVVLGSDPRTGGGGPAMLFLLAGVAGALAALWAVLAWRVRLPRPARNTT